MLSHRALEYTVELAQSFHHTRLELLKDVKKHTNIKCDFSKWQTRKIMWTYPQCILLKVNIRYFYLKFTLCIIGILARIPNIGIHQTKLWCMWNRLLWDNREISSNVFDNVTYMDRSYADVISHCVVLLTTSYFQPLLHVRYVWKSVYAYSALLWDFGPKLCSRSSCSGNSCSWSSCSWIIRGNILFSMLQEPLFECTLLQAYLDMLLELCTPRAYLLYAPGVVHSNMLLEHLEYYSRLFMLLEQCWSNGSCSWSII